MATRRRRRGARAGAAASALVVIFVALVLSGCGETSGDSGSANGGAGVVVEETGSIDAGDTRDPNHAGLAFDAYVFDAQSGDVVVVDVSAQGFVPLLKLVEVTTGAVLAEWEAAYSDDEALTYAIAGPGEYEARVYALEDGSGSYSLSVRIER